MAHFAKLDDNNLVTKVIVVDNSILLDEDGIEQEQLGVDFLVETFGEATWKKTSYNSTDRLQYAGIGYKYDSNMDAFYPPPPYVSWVLDINTGEWNAPVEHPSDSVCDWDEENGEWINCTPL